MGTARAPLTRSIRAMGGIAKDNRLFINAVFWIMRTGAPWRDLPPDYGRWSNMHRRFIRWRDKGVCEHLLQVLIDEPDYEWLMIEASHCKVHPHGAGARGGNQSISRTKGGSIQIAALGRKRLLASKEVARYRHKIREKHCIIPRCRTNQMYCPMD